MSEALAKVVPDDKIQLLIDTVAQGLSKPQMALFVQVCNRRGLDPFLRQIHAVVRMEWNERTQQKEPKMVIQTGIDGFRVVAERTKEFDGEGDYQWCGPDGKWVDVWLADEPPKAARVTVWRRNRKPTTVTARYAAYVQLKRDGQPNSMWKQRGPEQLAKCAAAQAFRTAFPEDLGDMYTDDEMGRADSRVEAVYEPPKDAEPPPQKPLPAPDKTRAKQLLAAIPANYKLNPAIAGKLLSEIDVADLTAYAEQLERIEADLLKHGQSDKQQKALNATRFALKQATDEWDARVEEQARKAAAVAVPDPIAVALDAEIEDRHAASEAAIEESGDFPDSY